MTSLLTTTSAPLSFQVINKNSQLQPMSAGEARDAFDQVKAHLTTTRDILLDLERREGWKALNYDSWRDAVAGEFGASQSTAYRQLAAAVVEDCLGEKLAEFGEISCSEGEVLKRLGDRPELIIQALRRATELAVIAGKGERTRGEVIQSVDEILYPNWLVPKEGINYSCTLLDGSILRIGIKRFSRHIIFKFHGKPNSISVGGDAEEKFEPWKVCKEYSSCQEYGSQRAFQMYADWQAKVVKKAELQELFIKGNIVRIIKDIPGCSGEIGNLATIMGVSSDAEIMLLASGWKHSALYNPEWLEIIEISDDKNAISQDKTKAITVEVEAIVVKEHPSGSSLSQGSTSNHKSPAVQAIHHIEKGQKVQVTPSGEFAHMNARMDEFETVVADLENQNQQLDSECMKLSEENSDLKLRIAHLEEELAHSPKPNRSMLSSDQVLKILKITAETNIWKGADELKTVNRLKMLFTKALQANLSDDPI